jgi:hypothetical protein
VLLPVFRESHHNRLPPDVLAELRSVLAASGLKLREGEEADVQLRTLRQMYEPHIMAMGRHLHMSVPPWIAAGGRKDNWQARVWVTEHAKTGRKPTAAERDEESGEHF